MRPAEAGSLLLLSHASAPDFTRHTHNREQKEKAMIADRIPMTPERYREMREELEALRMRSVPRTAGGWDSGMEIPGFGSFPGSDSAQEGTADEPVRERILALEEKIRRAQVIEPGKRDRVFFGAMVKVLDRDRNTVKEYALVGPEELEPECGRISSASPIGRALMGRRAGETVTIGLPKGELRLEILAFE